MHSGRTWGHLCALFLLLASSILLVAQEPHLASDPAAPLYRASPFAHGYIHGYEDGYHRATVALITGTKAEKLDAHPGGHAYKHEFGDRNSFLEGYAAGYASGASDAQENGFRAEARLRGLAEGVSAYDTNRAARFGAGLEAGFVAQHTGRSGPEKTCAGEAAAQQPEFCAGFRRGVLLASDSVAPPAPSTREVANSGGVSGVAVSAARPTVTQKTTEMPAAEDDPEVPLPAAHAGAELPPGERPF